MFGILRQLIATRDRRGPPRCHDWMRLSRVEASRTYGASGAAGTMISTMRSGQVRRGELLALAVFSLLTWQSAWHAAWGEEARAFPRRSTSATACERASFRVIVDVGHTAEVPGAMSARGVPEYAFNLRLAKLIERKLIDAGFAKTVLLITGGLARRGLVERVTHANHASADLLLSIHHDSVPNQFLQRWEYE